MQRGGVLRLLPTIAPAKPGPLSRPAERALASLLEVHKFIEKPGAESLLLEVGEGKAARTAVFPFEAFIRNALVRFKGPFKKHMRHVKALEDALGHHIDAIERLADMRKLGAPADVINHWAARQSQQRELLTQVLSTRWLPHKAGDKAEVPRLVRDLRAAPWGDLATDRDANAGALLREATRVVERDLDMGDMEQVHKLRRYCRWYALTARALSGAIVLVDDGAAPKRFKHYLTDPAAKLEFATLPKAVREPNALTLSRELWIGSAYIIEELAGIKSKGEVLIALTEALVDERGMPHHAAEQEALRIMKVSKKERDAWTKRAEWLHAEARDIFGAIADEMEAQMRDAPKSANKE